MICKITEFREAKHLSVKLCQIQPSRDIFVRIYPKSFLTFVAVYFYTNHQLYKTSTPPIFVQDGGQGGDGGQ